MPDIVELQKTLVDAAWPSGFERGAAKTIRAIVEPLCDEVYSDTLGNLICRKKGPGPKVVFPAHMDVLGLIITGIGEDGYATFDTIGGFDTTDLTSAPFVLENGMAASVGIRGKAKPATKSLSDLRDKTDLYLDIGTVSKAETEKHLEPGMVAKYATTPHRLGDDEIVTPYADNLMSCNALIQALYLLEGKQTANDCYFVFSVQEEVGLRGARANAFAIKPDYCVVLDGTHTNDAASDSRKVGSKLGGGAALKVADSSLLANKQVTDFLRGIAVKAGIPWQDDVMVGGGTDGEEYQKTPGGCLTSGISVPMRDIHTSLETVSETDVKNVAALVAETALTRFPDVKPEVRK